MITPEIYQQQTKPIFKCEKVVKRILTEDVIQKGNGYSDDSNFTMQ